MALVSGFGNSLSIVRGSGGRGVSQDRGSSSRYGFPLPPWLSLAPQPGPTRPGKGDRWRGSFSGARSGKGLSLPGPGSGPQPEGQGWSWRTGELKEKCAMNWRDLGSVGWCLCLISGYLPARLTVPVCPYFSLSPKVSTLSDFLFLVCRYCGALELRACASPCLLASESCLLESVEGHLSVYILCPHLCTSVFLYVPGSSRL